MNTFLKYSSSALLLGLGLLGCQPEMHSPKYDAGTADFSKYIAVGNSLTAGFSDGGLYLEGQVYSYPKILSEQFANVGGGAFPQAYFSDAQSNGSGYLRLVGFTTPAPPDEPSPITANVTTNLAVRGVVNTRTNPALPVYTRVAATDVFNNYGVPGIRMADVETAGYGNASSTGGTFLNPTPIFNPYFERLLPANTNDTYRARVVATNPTFFTYWLGNNDVLGYATSGGVSPITATSTFSDINSRFIDDLTARGAKGLVSTIPDVTTIPFFTTVGPTFRRTLTRNNVPGIVITTGAFSLTAPITRRSIPTTDIKDPALGGNQLFTLTAAPYLPLFGRPGGKAWRDVFAQLRPNLPPGTPLSAFLLSQGIDTLQVFGASAGNPIPTTLVLDDAEQGVARTATNEYNNALRTKAAAKGLALFDSNTFFSGVAQNGFAANGVTNTASFITGNLFSLDGVHPTPRGYAVIANEMIKAINAQYSASIPFVNPNAYRGVRIP
ncbi:SGNH/GDSL hydrolase family protein [Hymenobacter sp. 15J16-1T3B]|uniref:SGNH/GDSL hydrolase family protein n=1 Tax=Hymenobacter sp. 15J16-1T3B TaxID=2886941 RepID=UPI001D12E8C4|nr:SGNH/GDSL hydrolase family protein [Hymenobacter sp. 15J16-1T3B]MCC3155836.1 SGNH/GDSL hydrolase family protein [Hymenobacter sp. 15J16-1T3B]